MRTASRIFLTLLALFCGINLAETLGRSTLPLSLEGKIRNLELRGEILPGVDDVHLLWVGNRAVQIDAELSEKLRIGDRISKRAWERSLQTSRGRIPLAPSQDFRRMGVVMPWMLAAGWILARSASNASATTKRDPLTTTKPAGPASSAAR